MNIEESIAACKVSIADIIDSLLSLTQGKGGEKAIEQDGGNTNNSKNPHQEKMDFLRKALREAMSKLVAMQVSKVVSILSIVSQDKQKDGKTHEAQSMPQPHTVKFSSQGKIKVPSINGLNHNTTVTIGGI